MDLLTIVVVLGSVVAVVGIFALVMRDKGITGRVEIEDINDCEVKTRHDNGNIKLR